MVVAMLGCLKRIQSFLLADSYADRRLIGSGNTLEESADFSLRRKAPQSGQSKQVAVAVFNSILKVCSSEQEKNVIPITFEVEKGCITMILGTVGSGKSTLLQTILGETSATIMSGDIFVQTPRIGYCAQTPWLQNGTIRDNIIGPADFDERWYRTILHACCLEEDVAHFPLRDLATVGTRGLSVSGGQKHRIVSLVPLFKDFKC
jgi:ATP-binding cassette subfamily C (CFTR/MRP) protein 1